MRDRTFVNHTVRITVVKVACYTDLGEKYAQYRPGAERGTVVPCNFFKEGMTFTVQLDPFGNCKPEGFCDWAGGYLEGCPAGLRPGGLLSGRRDRDAPAPTSPAVPTVCGRSPLCWKR